MSDAPATPVVKLPWRGSRARDARPEPPDRWGFDRVAAIEIEATDEHAAGLLLDFAAPYFPAELVAHSTWIVRFHPPPHGKDWVIELLALVERWLESVPLPSVRLLHGERDYLIRPSSGPAPFAASTNPTTP